MEVAVTKTFLARLLSQYDQFYLQGEGSLADPKIWDGAALDRHLGALADQIAIGTASADQEVTVAVELVAAEPTDDSAAFDHVVEASLRLASGIVVLAECISGEVARLSVAPGSYRVRVAWDGIDRALGDGLLDGRGESFRVHLWPAPPHEPRVLKWYLAWIPKPPPPNPLGLRSFSAAEAWDTKDSMYVIGIRRDAERTAFPAFLYFDPRDGSYWDYRYDSQPPYGPILSEIAPKSVGDYQPWPGRNMPPPVSQR
jgi:hypothetical protein